MSENKAPASKRGDKTTKEAALEILSKNIGKTVSGQELARTLGVSRASVWKAVESLRKEGYEIDARSHAGYALRPGNLLSKQIIAERLNDPALKDRIDIYSSLSSTNNAAKQYAAEHELSLPIERIIIADSQTAGRGRRGRSFCSPPGSGVYISFLLCPNITAKAATRFTTAASVAVSEAIQNAFGIDTQIKWVNDVYLGGKKICGILTEAVTDFETSDVGSVVIGIGINMTNAGFPEELLDVAGSLEGYVENPDRNALIAELINSLAGMFEISDNKLEMRDYIDEYKKRSLVLGRKIRIMNSGETAEAIDIDKNGGLVVRSNGKTRTLSSGEISIRLEEHKEDNA